jgi:hypothetical protein
MADRTERYQVSEAPGTLILDGYLDTLASPHKEELASALRQYYVKAGKWEAGNRKQIEEVKKLREIFGE